jgi:hypothetical protein
MNFNDIYKKVVELDTPVSEAKVEECGMPMPSSSPSTTPPTMSVNLNAQGLDDIAELMKLMTKVNPEMMPKNDMPLPSMSDPVIKLATTPSAGDEMARLRDKMLPPPDDMDGDEEEEESVGGGFDSASTSPDEKISDFKAAIPNGNDLHKEKKMYPRSQPGDNPRAVESTELVNRLRESLAAELAALKQQ